MTYAHARSTILSRRRLIQFAAALAFLTALAVLAPVPGGAAEERFIVIASTTSTENSGLFKHLLPHFRAATGITPRVVAVGTGQAIRIARRGDADVLFVHDAPSERQFVADGDGVERREVMYNDFVIVGPAADPAGIAGLADAAEALRRIAGTGAPFVSRGDDSGTHKAERRLWQAAGIDAQAASGGWYREVGAGMGATLNAAAGLDAYSLSDRATWLAFKNKRRLKLLAAGDKRLFNQYGVILVNPARHGHVKAAEARAFIDWLTGAAGQRAIAEFRIDGVQVFFPNYKPPGS